MLKIALLACLAPVCAVAQTLECSYSIISTGTTQAEVAAKCGDPVQVDHTSRAQLGSVSTVDGVAIVSSTDVVIEIWTYNFGPTKLMQRIRFEDGRVSRIESVGYGY